LSERDSLLLDNEYIIMTEVSENGKVTQRELSKKLGVSVSTINLLMNKMIKEGLIKMTQVSHRQVLYMLTPAGMMEKAQKTVRYLKIHYRAIYETKEKIKDILDKYVQNYDVIYILMNNDEMSEILSLAVSEFKTKHGKSNIKMIYSMADINVKDYKSPALLYMPEYINDYVINDNEHIKKCEIINLAEIL